MRKFIFVFVIASSNAWGNCGSAFCSVNTNTEIADDSVEPGFHANVRYEFVNLDQPRQHSKKVGVQGEPGTHDELETQNQRLIVGVDYAFNERWAIGVQLPYIKRKHAHIHNPDADQILAGEEPERETWNFSGIGDVRAAGRYQLEYRGMTIGAHGGLKLPMGKHDGANDAGERAERSLQLGTGSTDVFVGLFAKGQISDTPLKWFAQTQWQHAIATKDEFLPGDEIIFDLGLSYAITRSLNGHLQMNMRYKLHDAGANAEPEESGGKYCYAAPGISYLFDNGVQIFGYIQIPIYQNVNGIQLTQSVSYLTGVNFKF